MPPTSTSSIYNRNSFLYLGFVYSPCFKRILPHCSTGHYKVHPPCCEIYNLEVITTLFFLSSSFSLLLAFWLQSITAIVFGVCILGCFSNLINHSTSQFSTQYQANNSVQLSDRRSAFLNSPTKPFFFQTTNLKRLNYSLSPKGKHELNTN